jgi:hypothetical protein
MLKRSLIASALTLCVIGPSQAQTHRDQAGTITAGVTPIFLYVSAGASQMALAVGVNTTLTVPSGATLAEICVEGASVRYRDDGSPATSSLGVPVSPGVCFPYSGPLANLSFSAQSGSPTIDVSYYKAN